MCTNHCMPVSTGRRRLLLGAGAMAATLGFSSTAWLGGARAATPPANAIPSTEALDRLMAGNARHVANVSLNRDMGAGRAARAAAQHPFAAIVACSDSRVAPEQVFDQGPGELFVVRVAGNIVDDHGIASLEYATTFLGTSLIVVVGHSGCGAVGAAVEVVTAGADLPGRLPGLAGAIAPSVRTAQAATPADLLDASVRQNVRDTVRRLETTAPLLAEMVASGRIGVIGAVYDIATGEVERITG